MHNERQGIPLQHLLHKLQVLQIAEQRIDQVGLKLADERMEPSRYFYLHGNAIPRSTPTDFTCQSVIVPGRFFFG
jgi:hypothetical protein